MHQWQIALRFNCEYTTEEASQDFRFFLIWLNFSSDIPVLVSLLELAYFQKIWDCMTKFNEAKNKYTPHMNTKASNKAKKHNYIPLDAKAIHKIKKKHRCWTRYRETGDKKVSGIRQLSWS
jgi:hypothetical protein